MANHFSGVGLMDLGTLDALKRFSTTKAAQPSDSNGEKSTESSAKEATEKVTKSKNSDEKIILCPAH